MPAKKQPKRSLKKTVRKVIDSLKSGAGPRINPDAIRTGPRRRAPKKLTEAQRNLKYLKTIKESVRPGDVFIMGPGGKKKRKPVGDPRLRSSDVFIMGPGGKKKRKPAIPKARRRSTIGKKGRKTSDIKAFSRDSYKRTNKKRKM